MNNSPNVSIITPITEDRMHLMPRLDAMVYGQDYPNIEWVLMHDNGKYAHHIKVDNNDSEIWHGQLYCNKDTIGEKLNSAIAKCDGEIILRWDSDDLYAPDWVSKSVAALINSKADITGLSQAYFHKGNDIYEYKSPGSQLYLCGATLCFWRKTWERKQFPEHVKMGEDTEFISNNGRLHCHGYKDGFLATIHGNNTCSHLSIPLMKKLPANEGALILKRFYP